MAKSKRMVIGSVCKNKDKTKANYLKINLYKQESVTLKHGQYLSVESQAFQRKSLEEAVAAGKLSEENATKALARIEEIPDWVLGDVVLITDGES